MDTFNLTGLCFCGRFAGNINTTVPSLGGTAVLIVPTNMILINQVLNLGKICISAAPLFLPEAIYCC